MCNRTNDFVEEFIRMLRGTSAQKFYRATPYTKTDGVDFQGTVSEKLFFEHFYVETENSKKSIDNIRYVLKNSPEATVIIKGYSGCGKTSFLHDLLYHHIEHSTIIDCEKGIDSQDDDPILTKITFGLVKTINDDVVNNNANVLKTVKQVFYDNYENSMTIGTYLDGKMLSHKFLKHFFDNHQFDDTLSEIYRGSESAKSDMANFILAHLQALNGIQRLFILIAWDICLNITNHSNYVGNIFCIDNLDNVEPDRIRVFLKYYAQFWMNMIHAFYAFNLKKWNIEGSELVQNYAFILVLRETTYAKLTEHFSGNEKGLVEEITADKLYWDCNVFENRSNFLYDHKESIPAHLLEEIKQIDSILKDKYIWKNITSIYNNDNSTAIKTLCAIRNKSEENIHLLNEYAVIKEKYSTDIRGSHGIVLHLLLSHFRDKTYFDDNLMLYNFKRSSENQNYKYSATRLLLSYLSNCREPVSMYQVFSYFDKVINPEDIANIFYQIYQLRFSDWRHLITFTDVPPDDYKWIGKQTNLYGDVLKQSDEQYAKVQITEAGKMYLKTIVPHFEFFSVRIENKLPLSCSRIFDTNMPVQKYISIIDRVFNSVKECNKRILETVNEICKTKNWTYKDYINSKFMYTNPSSGKKQFHGERVIFSHIGYINAFRKYVISCDEIPIETRATHNKVIAETIKKYLNLYDSVDCLKTGKNDTVKYTLYEQTLKVISNNANFSLPIEIEDDE